MTDPKNAKKQDITERILAKANTLLYARSLPSTKEVKEAVEQLTFELKDLSEEVASNDYTYHLDKENVADLFRYYRDYPTATADHVGFRQRYAQNLQELISQSLEPEPDMEQIKIHMYDLLEMESKYKGSMGLYPRVHELMKSELDSLGKSVGMRDSDKTILEIALDYSCTSQTRSTPYPDPTLLRHIGPVVEGEGDYLTASIPGRKWRNQEITSPTSPDHHPRQEPLR